MGKSSRRVRAAQMPKDSVPVAEPEVRVSEAGAILAVLIAGTPLCLLPGFFLSHDVIPKVIVVLFGAALILLLLPQWGPGLARLWSGMRGRIFLILAAAQCASLLVSTAFSSAPGLSLAGTVWRRFGSVEQIAILTIAVAAAATATLDRRWPVTLFRAISACGVAASLYGISQYFGFDPFLDRALYKLEYLGGIVRPPATMGHAIYFAAWLVPVALIAGASTANEESTFWRGVHAAAAGFAGLAIFLSGTRGALIALIAGAAFLAARIGGPGAARFRHRLGAAVAIVATAIAIVTISPAGGGIRNRLVQWREDLGGPRLAVWQESRAIVFANFLTGAGPETFAEEFRKIESEPLSRTYPDFVNETPHNALIDAACAQGLPGFLILAGVFGLGISGGYYRKTGDVIATGLQAAVLGILAGSVFASFTIVEAMVLWTAVGVGTAREPARERTGRAGIRVFWLAPAAVLSCGFVLTAVLLSVPDHRYAGIRDAVASKDFARAKALYSDAEAAGFGLPLPGYELYVSQQLAVLARTLAGSPDTASAWRLSADAAREAERRGEQRFSAAYQSCVLAIANGDLKRAEEEARISIDLAPNWYRPHAFLAQILQAMGRNRDAVTEQQLSIQLRGSTK